MLERLDGLFGTRNRTEVLVAVRLLGETYPSELATLLKLRVISVQRILESLESAGIVVSRLAGRTRLVTLSSRFFASKELDALLWALGKQDVELQKKLAAGRRRPRRAGKPGL